MNNKARIMIEHGYARIGTHWDGRASGLGDTILVTALLRELNNLYPQLKIDIRVPHYTEVFLNNPRPHSVFYGHGDNSETGIEGHYIEKLCDWFDIVPQKLYGEIYISKRELELADSLFILDLPKAFIHIGNPAHIPEISQLIDLSSKHYELIQVDQLGYRGVNVLKIVTANQNFRICHLRILLAGMSRGKLFIGVNSGPMHISACFQVPSLIFQSEFLTSDMLYLQNTNFYEFESYMSEVHCQL